MAFLFILSGSQFAYWEHTHLTLEVITGMCNQFSLDKVTGKRLYNWSHLFSDGELQLQQPVTRCDQALLKT